MLNIKAWIANSFVITSWYTSISGALGLEISSLKDYIQTSWCDGASAFFLSGTPRLLSTQSFCIIYLISMPLRVPLKVAGKKVMCVLFICLEQLDNGFVLFNCLKHSLTHSRRSKIFAEWLWYFLCGITLPYTSDNTELFPWDSAQMSPLQVFPDILKEN